MNPKTGIHLKKEDPIQPETLNRMQKELRTKVLIPKHSLLLLIEDKNERKSDVDEPKKPKDERSEKKNKKLDPKDPNPSIDTQPKKHKTDKKLNDEPEIDIDEKSIIKLFSVLFS